MIDPYLVQAYQARQDFNARRAQAVRATQALQRQAAARQASRPRGVTVSPYRRGGGGGSTVVEGGTAGRQPTTYSPQRGGGGGGGAAAPSGGVDWSELITKVNDASGRSGGGGGGAGSLVSGLGHVIGKGAQLGLFTAGLLGRTVQSSIKEASDLIGEATGMSEDRGGLPGQNNKLFRGKASWKDWAGQIWAPEAKFGVGQWVDYNNKWLDRAAGFAGDVVTDPTTYLLPGASEFRGLGGRAALAEIASKTLGEEGAAKAGRLGLGAFSRKELEQLGVDVSTRFGTPKHNVALPGTEWLARMRLKASGGVRAALADTRVGAWGRDIRADKEMLPYLTRLATGKGEMTATEAATQVAALTESRGAIGSFKGAFSKPVTDVAKKYAGRSDLFHAIEAGIRDGDTDALLAVKDAMFNTAKTKGQNAGVSAYNARTNHMPHFNTDVFEEFLGRHTGAEGFVQRAKGGPKASGRVEARVFEPGKTYTINGKDITFDPGPQVTAQQITDKFHDAFPELQGKKLIEDDPAIVLPRLLENNAADVGQATWEARLKADKALVDRASVLDQVPDAPATKEANDLIRQRAALDVQARKKQRTELAQGIRDTLGKATKMAQDQAREGVKAAKADVKTGRANLDTISKLEARQAKGLAGEQARMIATGKAQREQLKQLMGALDAADRDLDRLQKMWLESDTPTRRQAYQAAIDKRKALVDQIKQGTEAERITGQLPEDVSPGGAYTQFDPTTGAQQMPTPGGGKLEVPGQMVAGPQAGPVGGGRTFVGQEAGPPTAITPGAAAAVREGETGLVERTAARGREYRGAVAGMGAPPEEPEFYRKLAELAEGRPVQPLSDAEATVARLERSSKGREATADALRTKNIREAIRGGAETGRETKAFAYGDAERLAAKRELSPEQLADPELFSESVLRNMPDKVRAELEDAQAEVARRIEPYRRGPRAKAAREVPEAQVKAARRQRQDLIKKIEGYQRDIDKAKVTERLVPAEGGGVRVQRTNPKDVRDLVAKRDAAKRELDQLRREAPVDRPSKVEIPMRRAIENNPDVSKAVDRARDAAEFVARYQSALKSGGTEGPALQRAVAEEVLGGGAKRLEGRLPQLREASSLYRTVIGRGKKVPRYSPEEVDSILEGQWTNYVQAHKQQIADEAAATENKKAIINLGPLPEKPKVPRKPTLKEAKEALAANGGSVKVAATGQVLTDPKAVRDELLAGYPEMRAQYERDLTRWNDRVRAREVEERRFARRVNVPGPQRQAAPIMSKAEFFDKRRGVLEGQTRTMLSRSQQATQRSASDAMAGEFANVLTPMMEDVKAARNLKNQFDASARKAGHTMGGTGSTVRLPPDELDALRASQEADQQLLVNLHRQLTEAEKRPELFRAQQRQYSDAFKRQAEANRDAERAATLARTTRQDADRARRKGMSAPTRQRLNDQARKAAAAAQEAQVQAERRTAAFRQVRDQFEDFKRTAPAEEEVETLRADVKAVQERLLQGKTGRRPLGEADVLSANNRLLQGTPVTSVEDWRQQLAEQLLPKAKPRSARDMARVAQDLGLDPEQFVDQPDELMKIVGDTRHRMRKEVRDTEEEVMRNIKSITGVDFDKVRPAVTFDEDALTASEKTQLRRKGLSQFLTEGKGKGVNQWMVAGRKLDNNEQQVQYLVGKGMPEELAEGTSSVKKMLSRWAEERFPDAVFTTKDGVEKAVNWNNKTSPQLVKALGLDKGKAPLSFEKINRSLTPDEQMAIYLNGASDAAYHYIDTGQSKAIKDFYDRLDDKGRAKVFGHVEDRRIAAEHELRDTNLRLDRIDAPGGGVNVSHDPLQQLFNKNRNAGMLEPPDHALANALERNTEPSAEPFPGILPTMRTAATTQATEQELERFLRTQAAQMLQEQGRQGVEATSRELGDVLGAAGGVERQLGAIQPGGEFVRQGGFVDPRTAAAGGRMPGMGTPGAEARASELAEAGAAFGGQADELAQQLSGQLGNQAELDQLIRDIAKETKDPVAAARKLEQAVNRMRAPRQPGTRNLADISGATERETARADIAAITEAREGVQRSAEQFQEAQLGKFQRANAPDVEATRRFTEGMRSAGETRATYNAEKQAELQQRLEDIGGKDAIRQGMEARAQYEGTTLAQMTDQEQARLRSGLADDMVKAQTSADQARGALDTHRKAMIASHAQHNQALQGYRDNMDILSGASERALVTTYSAEQLVKDAQANVDRLKTAAPKRADETAQAYEDWIGETEKWLGSDIPDDAKELFKSALNDAGGRVMPNGKVLGGFNQIDAKIANGQAFMKSIKDGRQVVEVTKDQLKSGYVAFKSKVTGEDLALSANIDRAMKNMDDQLFKDPNKWSQAMDVYTRFFKAYATATPAFHIRNAMSATFMNAADGVSTANMINGVRIAKAYLKDPTGNWWEALPTDMQRYAQDTMTAVYRSGAGGQFSAQEIGRRAYAMEGATKGKSTIGNWVNRNAWVRGSQRTGEWVEMAARAGMAYDSLSRAGVAGRSGTLEGAVARINRIHFNYSEVSKFDAQARRFIPFWTFMSRNVPLQVQMMFTNPRAYSHYAAFARNFQDPDQDQSALPGWMQQGGAIRLTGGTALMPDVGATQIQDQIEQLSSPSRLLSSFNPAYKVPAQLITNRNFFYNSEYGKNDYVKASGELAPIGAILKAAGLAETMPDGGTAIPRKYADAFRNANPVASQFNRAVGTSPDQKVKQGYNLANMLLGLPIKQTSPEMLAKEAAKRQKADRSNNDEAKQEALRRLAAS